MSVFNGKIDGSWLANRPYPQEEEKNEDERSVKSRRAETGEVALGSIFSLQRVFGKVGTPPLPLPMFSDKLDSDPPRNEGDPGNHLLSQALQRETDAFFPFGPDDGPSPLKRSIDVALKKSQYEERLGDFLLERQNYRAAAQAYMNALRLTPQLVRILDKCVVALEGLISADRLELGDIDLFQKAIQMLELTDRNETKVKIMLKLGELYVRSITGKAPIDVCKNLDHASLCFAEARDLIQSHPSLSRDKAKWLIDAHKGIASALMGKPEKTKGDFLIAISSYRSALQLETDQAVKKQIDLLIVEANQNLSKMI